MPVGTLLVAVGDEDEERVTRIVETVRTIADTSETRVVVAHVVDDSEIERWADAESVTLSGEADESFAVSKLGATGEAVAESEEADQEREITRSEAAERMIRDKRVVRELRDALEDEHTPDVRGAIGDPAERIVEIADDLDADFVVVGGRRQSAVRKALFGSVSQEIIRAAPCPVISITEQPD